MALSHLRQPRLSLHKCRMRFSFARRRCKLAVCSNGENDDPPQLKKEVVAEETSGAAAEPFAKESSKKISDLFSSIKNEQTHCGSKKSKTLTDVFREHKDDQATTTAENEGRKTEEALLGVLLNFVKNSKQFEYSSHSNDSDDDHLEKFPLECEKDLLELQNAGDEWGEMSPPSESVQKGLELKQKSPDDQQAAKDIVKLRSPARSYQPFEHSNEPRSEDAGILGLVDFLRRHNDVSSNATSGTGLVKDNMSNGNSWIGDSEVSILGFNSRDGSELNASMEVSVPPSNKYQKKLKRTCIPIKISEENKVLVRFLPKSFTECNVCDHFDSCGEILKVEFPYAEGQPLFRAAYIYFKTREGLEKAIKKSGTATGNKIVTVESATSTEMSVKSHIPSLIGDPDVPTALVKNPARTIKIEKLTRDISSHHIEEALAFCESKVTGYFFGSSHSVAYVEFETEIGKERALAKQSIDVMSSHLVMLRIDSPRTTVVRISNMGDNDDVHGRHIQSLCRSLGDVKSVFCRSRDIVDVWFEISEWPNMWKILNRLNGAKFEDGRLQAEPAPVFPPEILLALWHQPEERKHLKATAQNLLGIIMEGTKDDGISVFASLENVFVDKF